VARPQPGRLGLPPAALSHRDPEGALMIGTGTSDDPRQLTDEARSNQVRAT
jgi:hypothetical protein